eukprot:751185-Hanusia_phi.AAC.1
MLREEAGTRMMLPRLHADCHKLIDRQQLIQIHLYHRDKHQPEVAASDASTRGRHMVPTEGLPLHCVPETRDSCPC